jgi:shikimate kinase
MRQGVVVWLDAPAPLLLQRLRSDPTPRPLLQADDPGARLGELLAQRQPIYAQADLRVHQAGDGPAQVAQQVLADLPAILKDKSLAPEVPVQLRQADGQITPSLN